MSKKLIRLQGDSWHKIKMDVKVVGYYEDPKSKRIKIFTQLMSGPFLYHWLNPDERAKFEHHKHKYPLMNNKAEIVKEVDTDDKRTTEEINLELKGVSNK